MHDPLVCDAMTIAGVDCARAPRDARDTIDGTSPAVVVEPATPEGVAATLAWARAAGLSVVLRGQGTKDAWGRSPRRIDILLGLSRLDRVIAHEAGDLTATVQAGARLADVNRALRQYGQWLPLDPPHGADATIGGVLATNDAGPMRHRYGTPRDLVIGMTVAMPDGVLSSSGGRVVKNVAGYDIARLMTGSHGSLAAIVSATFKLSPVPPASRTIIASLERPDDVVRLIERVRERQCEPEAVEVRVRRSSNASGDATVLFRYGAIQRAVDDAASVTLACADQTGARTSIVDGDDEIRLWVEHEAAPWHETTVLRLSWRPAEFGKAYDSLLASTRDLPVQWIGRAALGSGIVGIGGDPVNHARIVEALRATPVFEHVVIVKSPPTVRASVDVWSIPSAQQALWQALKTACDPTDTLNAGRGPL